MNKTDSCGSFRGNTKCNLNRCVCQEGCAGVDGVCTEHKYKVILEDFTLRNFRWGTYLYSAEVLDRLSSGRDSTTNRSRFTLMQTHDGEFIMYSRSDPTYAVAIQEYILRFGVSYAPAKVNIWGATDAAG